MRIRPTLLLILLRTPLLAASGIATALATWTLLPRTPLTSHDLTPALLLAILALFYGLSLGGQTHRYLTTRNFPSTTLWSHALLAGLITLGVTLLPATLILWCGLRSHLQEHLLSNPYYPLMAPTEMLVPFTWLAVGAVLITIALYARLRILQPARGPIGGPTLFLAAYAAGGTVLFAFPHLDGWRLWLTLAVAAITTLMFIAASRAIHRTMEFRS